MTNTVDTDVKDKNMNESFNIPSSNARTTITTCSPQSTTNNLLSTQNNENENSPSSARMMELSSNSSTSSTSTTNMSCCRTTQCDAAGSIQQLNNTLYQPLMHQSMMQLFLRIHMDKNRWDILRYFVCCISIFFLFVIFFFCIFLDASSVEHVSRSDSSTR